MPRVYGRLMPAFVHHEMEKSRGVWPLIRDKARRTRESLARSNRRANISRCIYSAAPFRAAPERRCNGNLVLDFMEKESLVIFMLEIPPKVLK